MLGRAPCGGAAPGTGAGDCELYCSMLTMSSSTGDRAHRPGLVPPPRGAGPVERPPMGRIGLVLGAGGVVGHAFHAGALAALADETGWDPRRAEIVVGTSAGSVAGALLRAGFSARDLYEEARAGRPSWRARRRLQRAERADDDVPAFPPAAGLFGALAS